MNRRSAGWCRDEARRRTLAVHHRAQLRPNHVVLLIHQVKQLLLVRHRCTRWERRSGPLFGGGAEAAAAGGRAVTRPAGHMRAFNTLPAFNQSDIALKSGACLQVQGALAEQGRLFAGRCTDQSLQLILILDHALIARQCRNGMHG